MVEYEYKVIPAPAKGLKAPGVKGPEARFAHALEHRMNELASEGWEYQRADILPSEERQGLTSTQTVYRSVLVFRREVVGDLGDQSDDLTIASEVEDDLTETEKTTDAPDKPDADEPDKESAEEGDAVETEKEEKHPA